MRTSVIIGSILVALAIPSQAQITQAASDSIVIHRMSTESRLYTIFSKDLQTEGATITTSAGELLELDYPLWIYFIRYDDQADETLVARRYLVVKSSDGNVLIVNTKNDVSPPDLETWRKVPADSEEPLDSLVLIGKGNLSGDEGIPQQNLVITSETEWNNLKTTMNLVSNVTDSFVETDIDFSKYQVITVFDEVKHHDGWSVDITDITENTDSIVVTIQNLDTGNWVSVKIQPYYIVKIPISDKQIIFHDEMIPEKFVLIAKGNLSGTEGLPKQNLIITSKSEWENLKTAMNLVNNVTDSFRETTIDFSRYQIIAIFDEVKPNGGWTVDIVTVAKYADSIVVPYTHFEIGDTTIVSTQPFHIVKIPLSTQSIIFQELEPPITSIVIGEGRLRGNGEDSFPIQNLVIKTQAEWDTLKNKMDRPNREVYTFVNLTDNDDIDFTQYQIIAIFDKVRTDTICVIEIMDMAHDSTQIEVSVQYYRWYYPYSLYYPNGLIQSYYIVKIPISEKSIVFQNEDLSTSNSNEIYKEDIVGKWRLTKIERGGYAEYSAYYSHTTYYAKYNIIYDFQEDDILIISGTIPKDLPEGVHSYNYIEWDTSYDMMYNFRINDIDRQRCRIGQEIHAQETYERMLVHSTRAIHGIWKKTLYKINE